MADSGLVPPWVVILNQQTFHSTHEEASQLHVFISIRTLSAFILVSPPPPKTLSNKIN